MRPAEGAPMKGRLNIFQATMLRWRELHPYNAVHVVRVDAPLDAQRLARDLDALFAARGLGGLRARRRTTTLRIQGRRRDDGRSRSSRAAPTRTKRVRAAMERGVNPRFVADGAHGSVPVLRRRCRHVVPCRASRTTTSSPAAIRSSSLLADIVARYTERERRRAAPVALSRRRTGPCSVRNAGYVLAGMTAVPSTMASARRSLRPRYPRGNDRADRLRDASDRKAPASTRWPRAARAWGVTRADLMIALLMQAIAPIAGDARHDERRREIGIASIVNIRRDFGTRVTDASFGQFLSSFRYCASGAGGDHAARARAATFTGRRRACAAASSTCRRCSRWPAWCSCGRGSRRRSAPMSTPRTIRRGPDSRRSTSTPCGRRSAGARPLGVPACRLDGAGVAADRRRDDGRRQRCISDLSYRIAAYTAEDIDRIAAALTDGVGTLQTSSGP